MYYMYFRNTFMDKDGFLIGMFIILFKHGAVSFSNGENNGNGTVFANNQFR